VVFEHLGGAAEKAARHVKVLARDDDRDVESGLFQALVLICWKQSWQ
jgi:hypothetical protein